MGFTGPNNFVTISILGCVSQDLQLKEPDGGQEDLSPPIPALAWVRLVKCLIRTGAECYGERDAIDIRPPEKIRKVSSLRDQDATKSKYAKAVSCLSPQTPRGSGSTRGRNRFSFRRNVEWWCNDAARIHRDDLSVIKEIENIRKAARYWFYSMLQRRHDKKRL